jgi:hypothetical protein
MIPVLVLDGQRVLEITQRLGPAADQVQDDGAAHQHSARQHVTGGKHRRVEVGQAAAGLAGPCHRHPQAGPHVGDPLRLAAVSRGPEPPAELSQALIRMAEVTEGDTGRLMGDRRGGGRPRTAREHRARLRQRLGRPGMR